MPRRNESGDFAVIACGIGFQEMEIGKSGNGIEMFGGGEGKNWKNPERGLRRKRMKMRGKGNRCF